MNNKTEKRMLKNCQQVFIGELNPFSEKLDDNAEFSFAFASDLHYEASVNPDIPEANARISCLLNDIKNQNLNTTLDFVLLSGDVTQRGSAHIKELMGIKELLDELPFPYFLIAGNHDLAPHRKIAALYPWKEVYHEGPISTSNFCNIFGDKGIRFSFQKGNIKFIGISLRNHDPEDTLDWLEHELLQTSLPKIVMAHYGLYPPRDSDSVLEKWGFTRIEENLPRLRSLIEHANSGVIAYLYGHNHINSLIRKNNILHVSGGGIQKGCTGYWLFRCCKNNITAYFHLLSNPLLHNFNYHGIKDPFRSIDSTHTTVEEYHKGNKKEQSFIILPKNGMQFI